jgi:hypothetical protein
MNCNRAQGDRSAMWVVLRCESNSMAELGQKQFAEMKSFSMLRAQQIARSLPDRAYTDAHG